MKDNGFLYKACIVILFAAVLVLFSVVLILFSFNAEKDEKLNNISVNESVVQEVKISEEVAREKFENQIEVIYENKPKANFVKVGDNSFEIDGQIVNFTPISVTELSKGIAEIFPDKEKMNSQYLNKYFAITGEIAGNEIRYVDVSGTQYHEVYFYGCDFNLEGENNSLKIGPEVYCYAEKDSYISEVLKKYKYGDKITLYCYTYYMERYMGVNAAILAVE